MEKLLSASILPRLPLGAYILSFLPSSFLPFYVPFFAFRTYKAASRLGSLFLPSFPLSSLLFYLHPAKLSCFLYIPRRPRYVSLATTLFTATIQLLLLSHRKSASRVTSVLGSLARGNAILDACERADDRPHRERR